MKKAPVSSGNFTSDKKLKSKQPKAISSGDSDSEPDSNMLHSSQQNSDIPSNILKQFEKMLHKALQQTSEQITSNLTREIRELGRRTEALEMKMEDIENSTQDAFSEIDILKEENIILQNRLEDYENRARRSNLRFRGLPESITDLQSTITALCQELLPGISVERLEMDRVHRALMPKKTDGPPRDIIAKFHFFRSKEQLLEAARGKNNLTFQGHSYQLFADLSQLTISKRRAMKPHLLELQRHAIKYQWGFPFSLKFTHQGTRFACKTPEELQHVLQDLKLIDGTTIASTSRRRSASASSIQKTSSSETKNGNHHTHKRGRFASSQQEQDDAMD